MPTEAIFFYLFAILAIAFSLVTVLKKNPAVSAFSLVLVFFSFAAIYALLGAHLISALQIIVYAGAIMVLFIFVIMLLNADAPSLDMGRTHWLVRFAGFASCATLFAFFVWVFKNAALSPVKGAFTPEQVRAWGGNTKVISTLLYTEYLYPFELTSALILAGIVGTIAIAKRKKSLKQGES
jgi:NADH-quinone oxidoreductase subunit J